MLYINRRGAAREDISKEVQYKEALLREIPIKLLLILKTYGIPESTPPQIGGSMHIFCISLIHLLTREI